MAKTDLTADQLREILYYDRDTGVFIWRIKPGKGRDAGSIAGSNNVNSGYLEIGFMNKIYYGHRPAWLYVYGEWPKQSIDHINGVTFDNRIENLREVSKAQNAQNQREPSKNNSLGFLGVSKNKNGFAASIHVNRRKIHIGTFDTPELAHAAYIERKRAIHSTCSI